MRGYLTITSSHVTRCRMPQYALPLRFAGSTAGRCCYVCVRGVENSTPRPHWPVSLEQKVDGSLKDDVAPICDPHGPLGETDLRQRLDGVTATRLHVEASASLLAKVADGVYRLWGHQSAQVPLSHHPRAAWGLHTLLRSRRGRLAALPQPPRLRTVRTWPSRTQGGVARPHPDGRGGQGQREGDHGEGPRKCSTTSSTTNSSSSRCRRRSPRCIPREAKVTLHDTLHTMGEKKGKERPTGTRITAEAYSCGKGDGKDAATDCHSACTVSYAR